MDHTVTADRLIKNGAKIPPLSSSVLKLGKYSMFKF